MADRLQLGTIEEEDGTYTGISGCRCGPGGTGWRSSGWPSKEIALDRIRQHRNEHETGDLMEPLSRFRARHGLVSAGNRAVFPQGAEIEDEGEVE